MCVWVFRCYVRYLTFVLVHMGWYFWQIWIFNKYTNRRLKESVIILDYRKRSPERRMYEECAVCSLGLAYTGCSRKCLPFNFNRTWCSRRRTKIVIIMNGLSCELKELGQIFWLSSIFSGENMVSERSWKSWKSPGLCKKITRSYKSHGFYFWSHRFLTFY